MPYSDEADVGLGDHVVPLERYGPSQSSSLKLTPLDMSMPRLYGARWVLCFPLPPGTDKDQVYGIDCSPRVAAKKPLLIPVLAITT